MRAVDTIVNHYSATYDTQDIGLREILAMHRARGWAREGYHEIVRLDGTQEHGRPWDMIGAGVAGKNSRTLHICCVGGLRKGVEGGLDTRTPAQIETNIRIIEDMLKVYPNARVMGHRDLAATQCPGYDVKPWWLSVSEHGNVAHNPQQFENPPIVTRGLLRVGRKGKEVRALKEALKKVGFHQLPITSDYFGQYTREEVMAFQNKMLALGHFEVKVDGEVGPVTWSHLIQQGGV